MSHPEVHPGLLGDSGRLEAPPFERDRGALHAAPQRVGAAVGVAPRLLEQPIDHAGTPPPPIPASLRTGAARYESPWSFSTRSSSPPTRPMHSSTPRTRPGRS